MYDEDRRNEDIAVRPNEVPENCAPPMMPVTSMVKDNAMWDALEKESPRCKGPAPRWSDDIPMCVPMGNRRHSALQEANKQAQAVASYIKLNTMRKQLPGHKVTLALCIGDTVIRVPVSDLAVNAVMAEFREMALLALKDVDLH